ncbi:MAG: zinc-dependent metalloprotease, partial [Acidimicrobiales bacterium]
MSQSPDPSPIIDWALAERIARWLAARTNQPSYAAESMRRDFDDLTARAEAIVGKATGLDVPTPARARVIDRSEWVATNVASFQRLLGPTLSKLAQRKESSVFAGAAPGLARQLAGMSRSVSGTQLALVLAWMSTRVLGQYDLLVTDGVDEANQDVVYFVGPNVASLEARYGFEPSSFRLWLALHELTHRAQFMAVPWLRPYFISLVAAGLEPLGSDPRRMLDSLRRAAAEI